MGGATTTPFSMTVLTGDNCMLPPRFSQYTPVFETMQDETKKESQWLSSTSLQQMFVIAS